MQERPQPHLQPRIEARNVTAGYGRRTVVHDVSFRLNSGEMVGIIGPNGAGKSTLLRVLSGALSASVGSVLLDGDCLNSLSPRERALRLAFVPQSEPAVFEFPVKEVVLMGRHAHVRGLGGESAADFEAAAWAMGACDILDLADRPVTDLSGGEHRRVLIARALAQRAPTLLLDEPVAHLDVTHQIEVLALARGMAFRDSAAVLVALHELNLAAEFCDRLILMSGGKILAEGLPERVMTPELLERAYGAAIQVGASPATGKPIVFPHVPALALDGEGAMGPRVHVICGGATGAALMASLLRRGCRVTAGVLNQLDSDQRAADALGITYIAEAPFSPVGESAAAECRKLIDEADTIIVTEVPIGRGNLANLHLAQYARDHGKPVLLIESAPFASRDYTDEEDGMAAWEKLIAGGARRVPDTQAAVDAVTFVVGGAADAR